jgi:hypothetical protein
MRSNPLPGKEESLLSLSTQVLSMPPSAQWTLNQFLGGVLRQHASRLVLSLEAGAAGAIMQAHLALLL